MMGTEAILNDGWGVFFLGVGAKGAFVLTLSAIAAMTLRRSSAALRHWLWLLGLVGVLALPFAELVGPRWAIDVPSMPLSRLVGQVGLDATPTPRGTGMATAQAAFADEEGATRGTTTASGSERFSAEGEGGVVRGEGSVVSGPAGSQATPQADGARAVLAAVDTETSLGASPIKGGTSIPLADVLFAIWAAGVVLLLGRLAASHRALRRLERDATVMEAGRVTTLSSLFARRMGIRRPVRILAGPRDAMPMSWGTRRPAVLLPRGAEHWPASRLEAVLLHELAHVRRRDCLTQLTAEVAVALHWVNPLAWVAAHRLRVEREHACDDQALGAGARASQYAQELLSLVRELKTPRGSTPVAVAMLGPAHLKRRLRAVLDADRPRVLGRGGAALGLVTATVAVMTLSALSPADASESPPEAPAPVEPRDAQSNDAPTLDLPEPTPITVLMAHRITVPSRTERASRAILLPQAVTCGMATSGWNRTSSQSRDDWTRTIEWSRRGCEVVVRIEGEIEFTQDFQDIERLGNESFLRIEEEDGSTLRMVEVTRGSGGRPVYEYRLNRDEQEFDGVARDWYEGMLLQVFRRSGFMARERAASLLRMGGVPAVLAELEFLSSDYTFATYVAELIEQADLTEDQAVDLVERSTSRVDSDHYMAGILTALAERHLDSERGLDTFLSGARTLESDHYRAGVLRIAMDGRSMSASQVADLVDAVTDIESDHYVTEVLGAVATQYFLDPATRSTYMRAVRSVESDHYRAMLLSALLDRSDLDADEESDVLRAIAEMESDHYKVEILSRFEDGGRSSEESMDLYLEVAEGIESDHYRAEALRGLIDGPLTEDQLLRVISATSRIDSDHYKAELLLEIVDNYRVEGAVREAMVDATETIGSRTYRGRVAERLLRR